MQNYFSPVDLRPLEIDDGPMLFEWRSNENVWKNFATKTPPTIEKHSEWLTENINSHAKRVHCGNYWECGRLNKILQTTT